MNISPQSLVEQALHAGRGLLALLRRRLRREAPPADTARMLAGVLPAREFRGLAPNA